jgi:hypothetical protein
LKKILYWGLVFTIVLAIPHFTNTAGAEDVWKTWNLVKDGELNTNKWIFNDNQVVTMSIDGDRVKFEHRPDTAGTSEWLQLIEIPECVKGIQVEITMGTDADTMPLDGNLRARIVNVAGAYGPLKDWAWSQMVVRNRLSEDGGDTVFGALGLDDPLTWGDYHDLIWTSFNSPEEVDGNTYLCTMIVDREKETIKYSVEGFGKVSYRMQDDLKPGWETFWAIGTKSFDALGSGTVWFSNVKVLLDTECEEDDTRPTVEKTAPEHKQKNVDVTSNTVEIKFNEPMNAFLQPTCEDGSCCPKLYSQDINGNWQEIGSLCDFVYIPTKTFSATKPPEWGDYDPNTKYQVCVPPYYFTDLAGNPNEEYCFKFTTVQ